MAGIPNVIRRLIRLRDVDPTNIADGRILVARPDGSEFVHAYEDPDVSQAELDAVAAAAAAAQADANQAQTEVDAAEAAIVALDAAAVKDGDAAGGDLTGTYPNPQIAANAVGSTEIADEAVTDAKVGSGANAAGEVLTADGAGGASWEPAAGGTPSGPAGGDLTGTYPNPDIAAGAVDAAKMDSGAAEDGYVATSDGAGGVVWEPADGAGSPAQGTGEWVYNDTTSEPPGANQIRFNNADPSLATQAWIRELTADGIDTSLWQSLISEGDRLIVQDKDDATRYEVYEVGAAGTDDGNYRDYPIANIATGPNPLVNGQRVRVTILYGATGSPGGGDEEITQTGHGLAVGDAVRLDGEDYVLAQADTDEGAEFVGFVTDVPDANTFSIRTEGKLLDVGLAGLTPGSAYYLSESVAGAITTPDPDPPNVSKPVLIAASATTGWIVNMRGLTGGGGSRAVSLFLTAPDGPLSTGDGKAFYRVPALLDGWNVTAAAAAVLTASSSGAVTIQVRRKRSGVSVDVLSTPITVDQGENDSTTAAAAVVNGSNDDLQTGDILFADCDAAGTGVVGVTIDVTIDAQ